MKQLRRWIFGLGLAVLLGGMVLTGIPRITRAAPVGSLFTEIELLAEAISIVRSDYVEQVDPKEMIYGALKGMLGSLDRHSQFLNPQAYTEMRVETKGEFGGVGMEITLSDEGVLMIVAPLDDTPSFRAKLKPNDKIVKIDGESTRGFTLHDAVTRLRGRPNSKVELTIFRESKNEVFDVTLIRDVIQIRSVQNPQLVAQNIGYIRISEFQDNTPRDLDRALKTLKRQEPLQGLILDLRNNPGGLLDVAVEVTQRFIPAEKMVVYTKGRVKDQNLEFISKSRNPDLDYPIVVLLNGGSASASEIVGGALRDHKRATLMGTKSFGKGSVQTVIPLTDGSAVRLTTSIYYTPSGTSIHGNGLEPDEVLEVLEEEPDEPGVKGDPWVVRAIEKLTEEKVDA